MVGQVGLEPTVFQKSRIYSPLQSPLCILTHMAEAGGLEPPDGFPRRFSRPVRYQLRSMLPCVVGATGFEPATTRLKVGCSNPTELRSHIIWRSAQNSNLIPITQYDPLSRRSPDLPGSRSMYGDPYGTRTRISSLRGWRPNRLDEETIWRYGPDSNRR